MILTVFTPVYNRAAFLPAIYDSLLEQDTTDFEWLIVDDGSTDNTQEEALKLAACNPPFPVRYIHKENGGKHTAINVAAVEAAGDYILWLDSDDRILPRSLKPFMDKLHQAASVPEVSAVVGPRLGENMKPLGNYVPQHDEDVKFLNFTIKNKVKGDYSWAIKKSVLQKYPFPVFEGERFCTEGVVLNRISEDYLTRFVKNPVIVGDYIPGGLTDQLHKLTKENPLGYLTYYIDMINSRQVPFVQKLKTSILYWNQRSKCTREVPAHLKPTPFLRLTEYPAKLAIMLYNSTKKR